MAQNEDAATQEVGITSEMMAPKETITAQEAEVSREAMEQTEAASSSEPKLSPEMRTKIKKWKEEYGDVYVVSSEGKTAYLRKPDRKIISAASVLGGSDNLKQKEVLVRNCWLGGDEDILNEDKYFLGLSIQVDAIIEMAQVELKKV